MINKTQTFIIQNNNNRIKVMIEEYMNKFRIYYSYKENTIFSHFNFIKEFNNKIESLIFIKKDFIDKFGKYNNIQVDNIGIITIKNLLENFNINIECTFDKNPDEIYLIYTDEKGRRKNVTLNEDIKIDLKNCLNERHYLIKVELID